MNKEARKVVKNMVKLGWRIARARKHIVMRCSCGEHQVVVPSTPGKKSCSMKDTMSMAMKCVA